MKVMDQDEVKHRIMDKALELFLKYGYAKTKMEEIARVLKISRKTLYKHFENKNHLLFEILSHKHNLMSSTLEKISEDDSLSVHEKIQAINEFKISQFPTGANEFILEIRDQAPDHYAYIKEVRMESVAKSVQALVKQGIEKGEIRKDLNPTIFCGAFKFCDRNDRNSRTSFKFSLFDDAIAGRNSRNFILWNYEFIRNSIRRKSFK